jgi:tripartite-type tricarboxylate transporter receptor subunit TctC
MGVNALLSSPADGYSTMIGSSGPLSVNPHLAKVSFDVQKSFAPISMLATLQYVLVAQPSFPASNVRDLVALLKANPGKHNFAGSSNGTTQHLAGELFKMQTKTFITHIPYRGAGPALQDLIAGQVDMMFDGLGSSAAHIKGGRIRGIAVASDKRAPGFPDVPTSAEGGVPTYQVATWYGIWTPKGTPRELITAMQNEMRKALNSDELKATWTGLGTETPNLWGADFGTFVGSEVKRWAEVVKSSGAKLD